MQNGHIVDLVNELSDAKKLKYRLLDIYVCISFDYAEESVS